MKAALIILAVLAVGSIAYMTFLRSPVGMPNEQKVIALVTINDEIVSGEGFSGTVTDEVTSLIMLVGSGRVTPPENAGGLDSMPNYVGGMSTAAGGMTIREGVWTSWGENNDGSASYAPGMYTVALYDQTNTLITSAFVTVTAE
jgi:hypothetical protein